MGEPSAARQWLAKVDGIPGLFSTFTGGDVTAETTKVYDGGEPVPSVISAPPTADNITLTRSYNIERDHEIMTVLRQQVGSHRTTVSKTPTDASLVAAAAPVVYSDALLVRFQEPEADASSGEASMWGLEFAVSHYR